MTTKTLLEKMIQALDEVDQETYFKLFDELQNRTIQALEDVANEYGIPKE